MKDYFRVTDLNHVLKLTSEFQEVEKETVPISSSTGRILAEDINADSDLPGFTRSTMDGFAVRASSTFGASAGNPAFLFIKGRVEMGEVPDFSVGPGEAAAISTGGMLPDGADSVVMVEYTDSVDDSAIEVFKSVAPGQNIIEKGEDYKAGNIVLKRGSELRPAEKGLAAAFGLSRLKVYKRPVVGIISTGDEVVPVEQKPDTGQIRDINSCTISAMVTETGGLPVNYGIINDDSSLLQTTCSKALEQSDMLIISGGSSVGTRDYTVDVLSKLEESSLLVHGISISPGKPTILADIGGKPVWGLPGHVVSAMVVFEIVVKPFLKKIAGYRLFNENRFIQEAVLTRNVPSAQGREEFVRVKLNITEGVIKADPVLGKSGMINTMVLADGLVRIPLNTEGLEKGAAVKVMLI